MIDEAHIGKIHINCSDINILEEFYTKGLLLASEHHNDEIHLGKNKTIFVLHNAKGMKEPETYDAGLYHAAILYTERSELASTVKNILQMYPENYTGCADHEVSEAFYFNDPEGNGLELYFDKPKEQWVWEEDKVQMGTHKLDVNEYIKKYDGKRDGSVAIGHIHLKVGNIDIAKRFYVEDLGFEITAKRPGALFISKNKYHHNIGLNMWDSEGAGYRSNTLGLQSFEIIVPSIEKMTQKLKDADMQYSTNNSRISVSDPWGTIITFREE